MKKTLRLLVLLLVFIPAMLLRAEDLTFRRAIAALNTIDPAIGGDQITGSSIMLTYETLLAYDYEARPYKLIPAAAEAMPEISEDRKVYTIRLRDDSWFIDDPCFGGKRRKVTAHDFVYGWKRLADAKVGSSGGWVISRIKGIKEFAEASKGNGPTDYDFPVEGLRALDDRTLRIELTEPFNQFLWYLTTSYMVPVAKEAVDYYGKAFPEHPVGNGPYRLRNWWRNYEVVFDRNPEWHGWKGVDFEGETVPFETIRYLIVREATTQWLMLLTGQLDFLEQIDRNNMDIAIDPELGLNPDLIRRGIRLHTSPTLKVYYLGLSMDDPVLGTNRYLRQALNAAFDSPRWIDYYRGRVEPLHSVMPPHLDETLKSPFPYAFDLEKARELMTLAGYPNGIDPATGKRLQLTVEIGSATQDTRESMELLASFLSRIGIDLNISVNTWQGLMDRIQSRRAQMFMMGWIGDYPDAETFTQLFLSRNRTPGPNHVDYVNPKVDALYDKAVSSPDPETVRKCWEEIQEILREDCPWLLLHYALDFTLVNERIVNYKPHAFPYGMEKDWRVRRSAK